MPRFTAVLTALEPIAHGDTQTGIDNATNTRLFMRSGLYVNGIPARVPDVSENSLRTVLFRKSLADDLLEFLGIKKGTLSKAVVNLLYSGGNMGSGAKAPGDQMSLGDAVKTAYPSLDLLGGAVDAFILPPGRLRLSAWPVAQEFAAFLRYVAPAHVVEQAERVSIYDMLFEETRTRGTGTESEGNQMLYTYETLAAGSQIFIEAMLDAHTPRVTSSAAGYALSCWDGFFGGQGRQGRGRMAIEEHTFPVGDEYTEHLEAHKDRLREGLESGTLATPKVICRG